MLNGTARKKFLNTAVLTSMVLVFTGFYAQTAKAQNFSVAFGRAESVLNNGDSFSDAIPVTNISDESINIRIYAGDWVRVSGQTSGYSFDLPTGNEDRSLTEWLIFSPERMTIEPGETKDIRFEINVPVDINLNGSYWAVIFIENVPVEEPGDMTPRPDAMQVGISVAFRYALQIYTTIEGTEIRNVTFRSLDIAQAEQGLDITAILENLGNIYLRPEVWLELRDTAGEVVYRQDYIDQTLLPESARNYIFEVRDLSVAPGRYLAMVIADYGATTLIAAQQVLDLTSSNITAQDNVTGGR
ncbi:MAG: hypothetical protein NTY09_11120 [bacterium]|nr:hypothetical protein [bacterium]